MKKILQVCGSLKVGGLETVAMNFLRYANREKYEFDFLVYGEEIGEYEEEAQKLGCQVIHIDNPAKGYKKFYNNLCSILIKYGPYDIIHSHTFFNSGIVMKAAAKIGIKKRISHAHSVKRHGKKSISKIVYNNIMRMWLGRYSTTLCACSLQAGNYVFSKKKFNRIGMIVPNIIDVEKYAYSNEFRNRIREELKIGENQIVIGQVGHLTAAKNQKFLLRIFEKYRRSHDAVLLLVGDGELKNELVKESDFLGILDFVRFTGTRSDVNVILSAMDVFVCTSTNEGFGIVLLEAKSNGLPCVIERDTLVQEIRDLGYNFEVSGFDVDEWCDVIDEANIIGRNNNLGVKLLDSIYSEKKFSETIHKLYD